jgi:hypothetical protein
LKIALKVPDVVTESESTKCAPAGQTVAQPTVVIVPPLSHPQTTECVTLRLPRAGPLFWKSLSAAVSIPPFVSAAVV